MTNVIWKMENETASKSLRDLFKNAQNLFAQSLIDGQPLSRTQIEIAAERRECSARAFQDRRQRRNVVIFQRGGFDHHVGQAARDQVIAVTIPPPPPQPPASAQPTDPLPLRSVHPPPPDGVH